MSTEDFEQRLRQQSIRPVPPEWRGEILQSASDAAPRPSPLAPRPWSLVPRLSALLWPSPKAWAALAAAWLVVCAVQFTVRDKPQTYANRVVRPSAEMQKALKEQEKLLVELMGGPRSNPGNRVKGMAPRPRSEISADLFAT